MNMQYFLIKGEIKMKKTNHQKLLDITFIALFAALCYIALTVLFIPFANMYIHFGNLIVVLAALLVGGWQGGLAGSIGMGFYDIFNGHADSSPKTFILKLLIGLATGLVYNFLKNRKKYPAAALSVSGVISLMLSSGILAYTLSQNHGFAGKGAWLCPLFAIVGVFCIVFALLKNKLSQKTASAVVGASCGMLVNLIGETAWKLVTYMLAGSSFKAAFASAALGQASTLINAGIAIVGGVALFCVLEKPFAKILNK